MTDSQRFSNLRAVSKMKHEQELLQISHDEIKLSLDTMTKDTYIYNKTILNLRMLELKIEIIKVDTEYIISRYLTPSGSICETTGYISSLRNQSIDCISQPIPGNTHARAMHESA